VPPIAELCDHQHRAAARGYGDRRPAVDVLVVGFDAEEREDTGDHAEDCEQEPARYEPAVPGVRVVAYSHSMVPGGLLVMS
jgi:hypothetical protein